VCKSYGGVCLTTSTNLHRIYTTCISHCSPSTLIQIQLNQLCNPTNIKVKVKVTLDRPRGPRRAVEVQLYSFLTSAQDGGGGMVNTMSWPLDPPEGELEPIVQEAGWVPRPVWTGAENLALTGVPSPDRPARLRYPGPNPTTVPFYI